MQCSPIAVQPCRRCISWQRRWAARRCPAAGRGAPGSEACALSPRRSGKPMLASPRSQWLGGGPCWAPWLPPAWWVCSTSWLHSPVLEHCRFRLSQCVRIRIDDACSSSAPHLSERPAPPTGAAALATPTTPPAPPPPPFGWLSGLHPSPPSSLTPGLDTPCMPHNGRPFRRWRRRPRSLWPTTWRRVQPLSSGQPSFSACWRSAGPSCPS